LSVRNVALPSWGEWVASGAWLTEQRGSLPLHPGLLADVLSLALDDDVAAKRLIRMVAREQVLAARVLRLANMAATAPLTEVTSVHQAVVRLGTRTVRRAVLSVCFASWAQPAVYGNGRQQIEHAVGTASLARLVAHQAGIDPDEAFTHALLHDIGKLFLLKLHSEFMRRGGVPADEEEIERVTVAEHASVGGMALQVWGLPVGIREPVQWHHEPLDAPTHARAAGVTYVANRLGHRYGFGCEAEVGDDLVDDPMYRALGLSDEWLADVDRQSTLLFEAANAIVP
jgi:putative nucleotidyltransferase with HDIG domain